MPVKGEERKKARRQKDNARYNEGGYKGHLALGLHNRLAYFRAAVRARVEVEWVKAGVCCRGTLVIGPEQLLIGAVTHALPKQHWLLSVFRVSTLLLSRASMSEYLFFAHVGL